MKKHYLWIILSGVLCAMLFKDPCFGPILGLMVGGFIGIPLYLIIDFIIKLILRGKNNLAEIIARYVVIGFLFLAFWLLFQPPGWLVFRVKIANPPPSSVEHIRAKWRVGLFDVPIYIKFKINKSDLEKVIINKEYKKQILDEYEIEDIRNNKWYHLTNINEVEIYIKEAGQYVDETADYHLSERIIYDPNTKQAFYLYSFWQ